MAPLGKQGFRSARDAQESAESHLYGIAYAILEHAGDYAWVAPLDYADRLVAQDSEITRVGHG